MPIDGIGQHVDGQALLGRAAAHVEEVAVAPHQMGPLVGVHPGQGRGGAAVRRLQHQAGVAGQLAGLDDVRGQVDDPVGEEPVDDRRPDLQLAPTGPAVLDRQLVAVLLGAQPGHRGPQPQRQVLRHDDRVGALGRQVPGNRQDAVVVVGTPQRLGQAAQVGVVELDAHRAAVLVDRHRVGQRAVLQAQVLEQAQRAAGPPSPARDGGASPPVRPAPRSAGRPRARRSAGSPPGPPAGPTCRARRSERGCRRAGRARAWSWVRPPHRAAEGGRPPCAPPRLDHRNDDDATDGIPTGGGRRRGPAGVGRVNCRRQAGRRWGPGAQPPAETQVRAR